MSPHRVWPHRGRPDARQLLGDAPVVVDTMIITGLARANRHEMLVASMGVRARIVTRVAGELRGHARATPVLDDLMPRQPGAAVRPRTFGELVQLTREEAQRASDLQRSWHGQAVIEDDPKRDRGEAEAIAVCEARGWILLSHDHRAIGPARGRRSFVLGLPELLMLFAAEGRCLATSAWKIYSDIVDGTPQLVCQGWEPDDETAQLFAECHDVLCGRPEATS